LTDIKNEKNLVVSINQVGRGLIEFPFFIDMLPKIIFVFFALMIKSKNITIPVYIDNMLKKLNTFLFNKYRFIGILTILLIFSFTFTSLISYNVTRTALTSDSKNVILPLISDNIYSEIQKELLQPIHNSSIMANDEFLVNWVQSGEQDEEEIVRYLQRIRERYGYFSAFFVSAITKNYYYYDGILKQISPEDDHDIWYYNFVRLGREYDLDVDNDEATNGTMTIFINHRLEDSKGNFLGVTGVGLQMSTMGETLESYRERFGHLIYMIDSDGLIQIHPDQDLILKTNIRDFDGLSLLGQEILQKDSETHYYAYNTHSGEVTLSARYFPDMDWYLIVEQDQTQTLGKAREHLITNIAIGLIVTILVIVLVIIVLNMFISKLEIYATKDEMTGLYNRRKMDELLLREIAFAMRYGDPLSLMILDIDQFKSVNDTYGHHAGDNYLKGMCAVLQAEVRTVDFLGRWGGEEFIVLLPKTKIEEAKELAERLRKAVEEIKIESGRGLISRTISVGIVSPKLAKLDVDEMIRQADEAMYRAKQAGGNQVVTWE
jgi:diguanylate cyclase (GGDEF)-like protein